MMNVDYDKLRIILMPHVLRQGVLTEALFRTAYVPLKRIYASLKAYAEKEEQEWIYGPTVKQLRKAVAEHLGISESVVVMGEVADREPVYLRRESDGWAMAQLLGSNPEEGDPEEGDPEPEEPLALWSDDMIWWSREFTVSLPESYAPFEAEVKAVLDRWKMAGSRYEILYY